MSHPAKDIGTMGFLFPVHCDWSGERFSPKIAVTGTRPINTLNPARGPETSTGGVTGGFAWCGTATRGKHGQPVSF